MRCAPQPGLEMRGGDDAQSLWMAATKRGEEQIPQGADARRPAGSAKFYGVGWERSGSNAVLARPAGRDGAARSARQSSKTSSAGQPLRRRRARR